MLPGHKWHPITDFERDPKTLTDGELGPLARVWARQKAELIERDVLTEFEKRLRREWSIETGIIENVYTLDRGVTRTLIEKGIDAALIPHGASDHDGTWVARIIQDHYDALEGMFDFVGGTRELSSGYIKELHAALLQNQNTYTVIDQFGRAFEKELEKGKYKETPNSPTRPDGTVHEYCPPEHVASEMDRLVVLHREHETRGVAPEVEAAWLHHRFTQIHPFADGNGRVARAIATLVFIKSGWFPLIVNRDQWRQYIEALEQADGDDLRPLIAMFVEAQRAALFQAFDVADDLKAVKSVQDAIIAVRDRLLERGQLPDPLMLSARKTGDQLGVIASNRLSDIARELEQETRGQFVVQVSSGDQAEPTIAGQYHNREVLVLSEHPRTLLEITFHAAGPTFRGFINVTAKLTPEGQASSPVKGGTFQINYEETLEAATARFLIWLDRVITEGLMQWRRTP
jgi:Fic family protein